ncbi:hypothetical protein Efla_000359 [Eimeria flavescens]
MPRWRGDSSEAPLEGRSENILRGLVCVYFIFAAAAAAAARWPLFASFAAHGKTRQSSGKGGSGRSEPTPTDSIRSSSSSSRQLQLLQWLKTGDCSKRRFFDFYLIGSLLTCWYLLWQPQQQQELWRLLPLVLLLLHLLRRLGEQLLLVASDEASRMHLFAYLLGCTKASPPSLPHLAAAVGVWLLSNLLQLASHAVLADLRRQGRGKARSESHDGEFCNTQSSSCFNWQEQRGSSNDSNSSCSSSSGGREGLRYGIPRGPLFAYTSCPHYLAEVLVYFSLCLLAPDVPL